MGAGPMSALYAVDFTTPEGTMRHQPGVAHDELLPYLQQLQSKGRLILAVNMHAASMSDALREHNEHGRYPRPDERCPSCGQALMLDMSGTRCASCWAAVDPQTGRLL